MLVLLHDVLHRHSVVSDGTMEYRFGGSYGGENVKMELEIESVK